MQAKEAFKRGVFSKGDSMESTGPFISMGDGEFVDIVPLYNMEDRVNYREHYFNDEGTDNPHARFLCIATYDSCPGCELGDNAGIKGIIPVVHLKSKTIRYLSFGSMIRKQLIGIQDSQDNNSIIGRGIRVKRDGTGMRTSYQTIPTGRSYKVDRFLEAVDEDKMLEELSLYQRDEILDLLADAGFDVKTIAGTVEEQHTSTEPELNETAPFDIANDFESDDDDDLLLEEDAEELSDLI